MRSLWAGVPERLPRNGAKLRIAKGGKKNLIHILPITITMCKWVGVFIHTATGYVRPDSLGTRVMGTLAHQYTYPLFDIGEVSIFFSDEPILNS